MPEWDLQAAGYGQDIGPGEPFIRHILEVPVTRLPYVTLTVIVDAGEPAKEVLDALRHNEHVRFATADVGISQLAYSRGADPAEWVDEDDEDRPKSATPAYPQEKYTYCLACHRDVFRDGEDDEGATVYSHVHSGDYWCDTEEA